MQAKLASKQRLLAYFQHKKTGAAAPVLAQALTIRHRAECAACGAAARRHPTATGRRQVKAARYSGPIAILCRRPTGTVSVPVTAAGVSSRSVISRSFGTTLAHWIGLGQHVADFVERHILLQLDGQRLRMAAHRTDAHAQAVDRDRCPACGTPGGRESCCIRRRPSTLPSTDRRRPARRSTESGCRRAAYCGSSSSGRHRSAHRLGDLAVDVENRRGRVGQQSATDAWMAPICAISSRMFCAPAPEAA